MNREIIVKLYKEAVNQDYFPRDNEEVCLTSKDLERLTELIVLECANFIDSREQIDKYGEALHIVYGEDLMKHFGVKE